jgi:hypothetical protein
MSESARELPIEATKNAMYDFNAQENLFSRFYILLNYDHFVRSQLRQQWLRSDVDRRDA